MRCDGCGTQSTATDRQGRWTQVPEGWQHIVVCAGCWDEFLRTRRQRQPPKAGQRLDPFAQMLVNTRSPRRLTKP